MFLQAAELRQAKLWREHGWTVCVCKQGAEVAVCAQAAEQRQRNLMLERQRAVKQQESQQRELVGAGAGGDGPDTGF